MNYEDRHYTLYEAAQQQQRKLERSIRKVKMELIVSEQLEDKDCFTAQSIRLRRLTEYYKDFSDKCKLTKRPDLMTIGVGKKSGKSTKKSVTTPPKSSIIKTKAAPPPKTIAGVAPSSPMSFDEADTGKVNLKYAPKTGYSINCQTCVPVFEARQRGYNVRAKENISGSALETLSHKTNLIWIDPKTGKNPDYIFDNTRTTAKQYLEFIKNTVKKGERHSIEFTWKGSRRDGHIVNIDRNENSELRIKDNQRPLGEKSEYIGDVEVLGYLSRMKYQRTFYGKKYNTPPKLLRLDNMEFEYSFADKIMEDATK